MMCSSDILSVVFMISMSTLPDRPAGRARVFVPDLPHRLSGAFTHFFQQMHSQMTHFIFHAEERLF